MKDGCKKLLIGVGSLLPLIGCNTAQAVNPDEFTVFPTPAYAWVGDPMPFYDEGSFEIFYLHDARSGSGGFHPWALMQTQNFYDYTDRGEVIPFVNDFDDQELALGTGSVIKVDGLYHAFYTAHNGSLNPKEAIMHATSTDKINWTKIPENTFFASSQYNHNDFRDPYVFYNEQESQYWMLITTRKNNQGVIALYTSTDLKTWQDDGVLFENDMGSDSNLECPTLLQFGDYWYLSFSDQWPDRMVHYRIATNPRGPFEIPERDVFDGAGFYAGRMEKSEDELFVFGWVPTKVDYLDEKDFDWAGNLVVHQLIQQADGTLNAQPISEMVNQIKAKQSLEYVTKSSGVKVSKNNYTFSESGYESVIFPPMGELNKIKGQIEVKDQSNLFGFTFNAVNGVGNLNIVFDTKENQLKFYNANIAQASDSKPQIVLPLQLSEGSIIDFTLVVEDTVAALYVNDEIVLTTRMFSMPESEWGLFSLDSNIEFKEVTLYQ